MKTIKHYSYLLIKYFFLLIVARLFYRIFFTGFNIGEIPINTQDESILNAVFFGVLYDLKWASFFIIMPLFIIVFSKLKSKKWLWVYTMFWVTIWSLYQGFSTFYYQEWAQYMTRDSLQILYHEGFKWETLIFTIKSLGLSLVFILVLYFLFNQFLFKTYPLEKSKHQYSMLLSLLIFISGLFVGNNYLSNHSTIPFYNHLAQGPPLMFGQRESNDEKWLNNDYIDMNVAVDNYYALFTNTSHRSTLDLSKKDWHIVIVLLTQSTSNEQYKNFIHFEKTLSGSNTLNSVLSSLINGYPSLPHINLLEYPDKIKNMPSLPRSLKKAGYTSSIYISPSLYDIQMNNYIKYLGFDRESPHIIKADNKISSKHFSFKILDNKDTKQWLGRTDTLDQNMLYIPFCYTCDQHAVSFYLTNTDTSYNYTNLYSLEDLPTTLLNILKVPTGSYIFSKDMMTDSIPHFYFGLKDGKAIYRDDTSSFSISLDKPIAKAPESTTNSSDYLLSILQMVQEDFRSK